MKLYGEKWRREGWGKGKGKNGEGEVRKGKKEIGGKEIEEWRKGDNGEKIIGEKIERRGVEIDLEGENEKKRDWKGMDNEKEEGEKDDKE